jgi:hypothetical protein
LLRRRKKQRARWRIRRAARQERTELAKYSAEEIMVFGADALGISPSEYQEIVGASYHVDWEEPPPIPNGLPQAAWQYNGFRALPAAAFWPVWLSVKMWAKIIPPRDQNKCGTALYLT